MKSQLIALFVGLALITGGYEALSYEAVAPTAQFFRLVGPTEITITKFGADGSMVWSGATPGGTYTLQIATTLAGGGNWTDQNQIVASGTLNTNIVSLIAQPPAAMVLIPAGQFTIGDTLDGLSDALPTNVTVSAFYMDVNLVTSNQWAGVYNYAKAHDYFFTNTGSTNASSAKAANHPVQMVEWFDCVAWCNARSQMAGLIPCYYTDTNFTKIYTNALGTNVWLNIANNGYRLPTEAEWEKAARGGLSGNRFPWGSTITESQANYSARPANYSYDLGPYSGYNTNFVAGSFPYTSPVGSFAPNSYGLYDMAGNVGEWCWDWYAAPPYPAGSAYLGGADPTGPAPGSGERVFRGGYWVDFAYYARCAYRDHLNPGVPFYGIGFRCVKRQ